MKRFGNLFEKICSIENLQLADAIAQMGKQKQYGVVRHNGNAEANIQALHEMLINKTYKTSPYTVFKVYEPKEREVFRLPYFPDRILHHAIMNVLEPILTSTFISTTYACIKGRGVHAAGRDIKKSLQDNGNTLYCLKIDVAKFYPSVDHEVLKQLLRRKFKDADLLWLLDEIIDSAPGLPIGNYLSQSLSCFYLSGFDHWLKEQQRARYYFRYMDDMIILAADKAQLHEMRSEISNYLQSKLKLNLKNNWQVFPVDKRGIDVVGYRFFRKHTLLRKRIKQNFARAVALGKGMQSLASYMGWAKHCDSKHLIKKLKEHESFCRCRKTSFRLRPLL